MMTICSFHGDPSGATPLLLLAKRLAENLHARKGCENFF